MEKDFPITIMITIHTTENSAKILSNAFKNKEWARVSSFLQNELSKFNQVFREEPVGQHLVIAFDEYASEITQKLDILQEAVKKHNEIVFGPDDIDDDVPPTSFSIN